MLPAYLSSAAPLVISLVILSVGLPKVIALWLSLRDTKPSDRPGIIKALAELFRSRPWRR